MGINPADQPLLEQQHEDSYEAWQKRTVEEAEEPWAFPDDGAGSKEVASGCSDRKSSSAMCATTLN